MSDEERKLWALLVQAEITVSANMDLGHSEVLFHYEKVSAHIQARLLDEFGVNAKELLTKAESQLEALAKDLK